MRKLVPVLFVLQRMILNTHALEIEAPPVPDIAADQMPDDASSFSNGLIEILRKSVSVLDPAFSEVLQTAAMILCIVMLLSMIHRFSTETRHVTNIAGIALITSVLLKSTNALILLAIDTIQSMSEYGKLLLPVMTAAMASQGSIAASTALYTGTAVFDLILTRLISRLLVPAIYVFLVLAVANGTLGEDTLKKMRDMIKGSIGWTLKTILTVFTTYMSITRVVSGTTDAVTLKATKFTISSVVPVVGGILSDASEAILVSAGVMKNAAGVYGILAILAVFLVPFLKIWIHYLVLKLTGALCSLFGTKQQTDLIEDFSSAMGILLAMTGAVCLLLLVSTVCFLRSVT